MATPKIIFNNFILYGLNRERNFLQGKVGIPLLLESKSEVEDFCATLLHTYQCPESGMFAVFQDGTYWAIAKCFDEDGREKYVIAEDNDMHFFSEFDADMRLCCYGMICEIKEGWWKIQ